MAKEKLSPIRQEYNKEYANLQRRLRYAESHGYDTSGFEMPAYQKSGSHLRQRIEELQELKRSNLYSKFSKIDEATDDIETVEEIDENGIGILDDYLESSDIEQVEEIDNDSYDDYADDEYTDEYDNDSYDDYADEEYTDEYDRNFAEPTDIVIFNIFDLIEQKIDSIPDYREYKTKGQYLRNDRGRIIYLSGYKARLKDTLAERIRIAKENGTLSQLSEYFYQNYEALQSALEAIEFYLSAEGATQSAYILALQILKGGNLNDEEREEIEDYTYGFESVENYPD